MRFTATIQVEVEIDAQVTRGRPEFQDLKSGVWQPGNPDEITKLGVFMAGDWGVSRDISEYLSDSTYKRVEQLVIEKFHDFSKEVDYDES